MYKQQTTQNNISAVLGKRMNEPKCWMKSNRCAGTEPVGQDTFRLCSTSTTCFWIPKSFSSGGICDGVPPPLEGRGPFEVEKHLSRLAGSQWAIVVLAERRFVSAGWLILLCCGVISGFNDMIALMGGNAGPGHPGANAVQRGRGRAPVATVMESVWWSVSVQCDVHYTEWQEEKHLSSKLLIWLNFNNWSIYPAFWSHNSSCCSDVRY